MTGTAVAGLTLASGAGGTGGNSGATVGGTGGAGGANQAGGVGGDGGAVTVTNFTGVVTGSLLLTGGAGGNGGASGNAAGGWGFPTGHAQGFPGSQLPPVAKEERDVWSIRAGTAEVAWTSVANHGGGYQYSLCPVGSQLTEACFHKLPLQFASDKQVLRYMYTNQTDNKTEVEITATRVSQGTIPAGSTWTRNPV